jgi:hypothetical protein
MTTEVIINYELSDNDINFIKNSLNYRTSKHIKKNNKISIVTPSGTKRNIQGYIQCKVKGCHNIVDAVTKKNINNTEFVEDRTTVAKYTYTGKNSLGQHMVEVFWADYFFPLIFFKSNYLGNNNIGFRLEKYFRNIFILEEKKV